MSTMEQTNVVRELSVQELNQVAGGQLPSVVPKPSCEGTASFAIKSTVGLILFGPPGLIFALF